VPLLWTDGLKVKASPEHRPYPHYPGSLVKDTHWMTCSKRTWTTDLGMATCFFRWGEQALGGQRFILCTLPPCPGTFSRLLARAPAGHIGMEVNGS
jgi:hypothetical protein